MSKTDFFAELGKAKENYDFLDKDEELIKKMRVRTRLEAERKQMGKVLATADKEILLELQKMGFRRKTIRLLHLVPLIQVAWSEGTVTNFELRKIIEIAQAEKRLRNTQLEQLLDWINHKPSDEFFATSLKVVRLLLESLSDEEKAESKKDLISYCIAVARASDSVLGSPRRVSDKERAQMEEIAMVLDKVNKSNAKNTKDNLLR